VTLLRYWYTLRDLRPVQIYGRIAQRLVRPRPDHSPAPECRPQAGTWVSPARQSDAMLGPRRFRFLGEERELSWPQGWNDPAIHKLWLFNLHYFADLASNDADERTPWHRELIARWINENPPFAGHAWVPYCVSQRIVNWIKWLLVNNDPVAGMLDSLALQTRYLEQRIERHLQGNHLLANAMALAFAGLYFGGTEGDRWLAIALDLLRHEVPQQILRDGGHYELSPMYHSLVLEHLLDVTNAANAFKTAAPEAANLTATWRLQIEQMRRWLHAMTFPDGQIALFSDSALEIAPVPAELDAYAERLGLQALVPTAQRVTQLADSGYVRLASGPAVLIADVGPLGARYQPGHGHADVLSFELALGKDRLVVDTGTSVYYGNDSQRLQERGTAAHNTVTVDGENSSEVWDVFRVARRAKPVDHSIDESSPVQVTVGCGHDGYLRLAGRVRHHRAWRLSADELVIEDQVAGQFASAIARFHLDPLIRVTAPPEKTFVNLELGPWQIQFEATGSEMSIEPAEYHPRFGTTIENLCLVCRLTKSPAVFRFRWSRR
jgi:uncharacterized heparinase superfamily protein